VGAVRATGLFCAVAAGAVALLGGHAEAGVRTQSCTPGIITFGGAQARVFCGPAKATVKIGTKVLKFSQGECLKTSQYISVNIGTVVLGQTSRKKPNYFGMNVGRVANNDKPAGKDGTYRNADVAIVYGGKGYLTRRDTIVSRLTGGRTKATFTGKTFDGKSFSGSFTC
jgi:hypothetical protein